jgi:hypothetical protein
MPTVVGTIRNPDGTLATGTVTFRLVGEAERPQRVAFLPGSDQTIESSSKVNLVNGAYSISLPSNDLIIPAGTRWARSHAQSGQVLLHVTETPATQREEDILADPPGTLPSAALSAHEISASAHSSLFAAKVAKAGDTMTGSLVLSGGATNLTVGGDATITGEILTGTFGSPATFGGIEREARVWSAGQMMSPTAVMNFGDGFPRLSCPDGDTTDVYVIFEVEEWWLDSTIGVYFEWVNDHTTTGGVDFEVAIKECDIGTQTLAAAGTIATRTFTEPSPAANISTTSIVASVANGNPCSFSPGALASFYVLRITRFGAADALAGPIGIVAASMTRGQ